MGTELERAKNELFLEITKGRSGTNYSAVVKQSPDDSELDIVTRSVESVEALWEQDQVLQAKLGIKLDQSGRSLWVQAVDHEDGPEVSGMCTRNTLELNLE